MLIRLSAIGCLFLLGSFQFFGVYAQSQDPREMQELNFQFELSDSIGRFVTALDFETRQVTRTNFKSITYVKGTFHFASKINEGASGANTEIIPWDLQIELRTETPRLIFREHTQTHEVLEGPAVEVQHIGPLDVRKVEVNPKDESVLLVLRPGLRFESLKIKIGSNEVGYKLARSGITGLGQSLVSSFKWVPSGEWVPSNLNFYFPDMLSPEPLLPLAETRCAQQMRDELSFKVHREGHFQPPF